MWKLHLYENDIINRKSFFYWSISDEIEYFGWQKDINKGKNLIPSTYLRVINNLQKVFNECELG